MAESLRVPYACLRAARYFSTLNLGGVPLMPSFAILIWSRFSATPMSRSSGIWFLITLADFVYSSQTESQSKAAGNCIRAVPPGSLISFQSDASVEVSNVPTPVNGVARSCSVDGSCTKAETESLVDSSRRVERVSRRSYSASKAARKDSTPLCRAFDMGSIPMARLAGSFNCVPTNLAIHVSFGASTMRWMGMLLNLQQQSKGRARGRYRVLRS